MEYFFFALLDRRQPVMIQLHMKYYFLKFVLFTCTPGTSNIRYIIIFNRFSNFSHFIWFNKAIFFWHSLITPPSPQFNTLIKSFYSIGIICWLQQPSLYSERCILLWHSNTTVFCNTIYHIKENNNRLDNSISISLNYNDTRVS